MLLDSENTEKFEVVEGRSREVPSDENAREAKKSQEKT